MSFLLAAAAICSSPSVHDGDTIRCGAERVRIANIDAPELPGSSKCKGRVPPWAWCDYQAGAASRDALRSLVAGRQVMIEREGVDAYGRTLARVYVGGMDVGDWLISKGLAKRWK